MTTNNSGATKRTAYRVTASAVDRNGVRCAEFGAEVLGDDGCVYYATEELAQLAAEGLTASVEKAGLDPSTEYEVEEVEIDGTEEVQS